MNILNPCRSVGIPFVASPTERKRFIVRGNLQNRNTTDPKLLLTGFAPLLVPGYAWAEDIVSEAQNLDLPNSLPESLPSAEQVISNAPTSSGSLLDIFTDNPIVVFGLLFLAAVPVILNFFGGGALGVKQVNAAGAVEGLMSDPNTVLVDIRSREEVKEQGSPNLSSTKKKAITLPFTRLVKGEVEEVEDFLEKFSKLKQIKSDTSIILLDSYGKEAPAAAKVLAKSAGRVYFVQDGSVGLNGWKESGQPWKEPIKSFLNLDSLAEDFRSQPTLTKAGVAVGAVGVASAVLFQEAGAVLELAALAAAGAFALPRFLGSGSASTVQEEAQGLTEEGESAAKQTFSKAKKASRKAGSAVEDSEASDIGSKAQEAADSVQDTLKSIVPGKEAEEASAGASDAAEDLGSKAEGAAEDVKGSIAKQSGEARQWIDDWKKEQAK